ncbi:carbon-phosphorus lyase complex subunit PhnI [Alkalimarinus alittae]|uniref:Carbon-phosphorus lyase complex subunit PhnI n=1 Tax=Alkalimarinus alittae TaxID=2961619 RepID=A0ABY6N2L0_9ALTE|nr:carbon-phosphorus lyase complex subunit PhnI [Alkalimarinus alittae]UZE96244.1 carbon-phosphorus lyase complex subunit PhnI [Alkalimarinus alittae]
MYVAVKGGEKAIDNAHQLLAEQRRGDRDIAELSVKQIMQQLKLAVARVMTEGSLYDPELAALAIKQASGDLVEAIFLLRAYRTTLPRLGQSEPIETADMSIDRRISATYKDLPGGQVLGPTYDYTHRLLDFKLLAEEQTLDMAQPMSDVSACEFKEPEALVEGCPRVLDLLNHEGLIESASSPSMSSATETDITREPLSFPTNRAARLQSLARGDEGFLLALGYSTQRGYGRNHPFAGEIRMGEVAVEIVPEELGFTVEVGDIEVTECEMINQFSGSKTEAPRFTRGYGLGFGQCERKAMSMALVDRSLRAKELGEEQSSAAQDEEFVLSHCDNVEANGFVSHLKLPHYVDFQSELELLRRLRKEFSASKEVVS